MSQSLPTPYFEGPKCREGSRRLLLISYHFPPSIAAGATRWEGITRIAEEYGWAFDVIMDSAAAQRGRVLSAPSQPAPGLRVFLIQPPPSRTRRLVEELGRVFRSPRPPAIATATRRSHGARTSYARAEIRWWPPSGSLLRRTVNVAVEHAEGLAWASVARGLAMQLASHEPYRAVISSGPPHYAHEAARQVARALAIPSIMDMRDPWSLQQRLIAAVASPAWFAIARRLERSATRRASLIVANTEAAASALAAAHPGERERILTAMNGWDDGPLPPLPTKRFLISYVGTVYLDRNPLSLFKAVRLIVERFGLGPEEVGIEFMGAVETVDGTSLENLAHQAQVGEFLVAHPAGARQAAQEVMQRAAVLVSLPQDSDLAIPSKVFEYMRCPAHILALADPGSATALLLRGTGADVVSPSDSPAIAEALGAAFVAWREGHPPVPIAATGRFSRRGEADRLLSALDRLLPG